MKKVASAIVTLILIAAFAAGGYIVYRGLSGEDVETMPLPEQTFEGVPEDVEQIEPGTGELAEPQDASVPFSYEGWYRVYNADTGGYPRSWDNAGYGQRVHWMSVEAMAPNSVFSPDLQLYSEFRADDAFVDSRYKGFDTLRIPNNPRKSVLYAAGAPVTVADKEETGTTLIASHIAHGNIAQGAFYTISRAKAGYRLFTKDAEGQVQEWVVYGLTTSPHKSFPQEYFSTEGQRRLVLVTCGGRLQRRGTYYYGDNVFLQATPVYDDGSHA